MWDTVFNMWNSGIKGNYFFSMCILEKLFPWDVLTFSWFNLISLVFFLWIMIQQFSFHVAYLCIKMFPFRGCSQKKILWNAKLLFSFFPLKFTKTLSDSGPSYKNIWNTFYHELQVKLIIDFGKVKALNMVF